MAHGRAIRRPDSGLKKGYTSARFLPDDGGEPWPFGRSRHAQGEPRMSNVTLNVNGRAHTLDVDPATPLLYVLRNDLDLRGPRFGCGLGQCGACTVIIN